MQHTTEFSGMDFGQRLSQLATSGSYPALCLWYGAGGAIAALARIVGGNAPFGVAFLAAVPFRFTLPATLGVALGYLLGSGVQGAGYIVAGALLTLLRWVLRPARWEWAGGWLVPLSASAAVLAAGVLPFLYRDPLLYDIILWGTQVVIAGASAAFLQRALSLLEGGRTTARDTALWVLFCISIMGLCTLELGGVSAGQIAAATAVLFAARVGGVVGASMTGVVCGFATGFAGGNFTLWVTLYSLGGLMAGLFGSFGRVGSAIAFTATYGFVQLLTGEPGAHLVTVALAGVIFLMLPRSWFKFFAVTAMGSGDGSAVKAIVTEQLGETTAALRHLSRTTAEVAGKLGRLYTGDVGGIYDRTAERVCKKCAHNARCWQEQHGDTVDALAHGLRKLSTGQCIDADSFPPQFDRCVHRREIAASLQAEYGRYSRRDEQQRRTARIRRLMSDQLEGIALALEEMGGELAQIHAGDSVLQAKVEAVLEEHLLEPQQVVCWRTRGGKLALLCEIPSYQESRSAPELLTAAFATALEIPLSYPIITRQDKVTRMRFCERPRFAVEYGSCQLNCDDSAVCGDSFRIVNTDGTTANLLLSDGMGSGNNAAVDSAMAASLTARLLEAGLSYGPALKLINGALLVKSGDESLATLDAARIDLYTGKVSLYKAGAAPTVVRKDGRGIEIDSASLPAGIMEGVEFAESSIVLDDGDLLLLLSDGAVPDSSDWIARAVEGFADGDLDQFCRKLATTARLRRTDNRDDDITVLCCRLTLNKV